MLLLNPPIALIWPGSSLQLSPRSLQNFEHFCPLSIGRSTVKYMDCPLWPDFGAAQNCFFWHIL